MKNEFKTEIINTYLKENKMSKTKFCRICGINLCTLTNVMNNKNYRIDALFKIARVVKLQVYEMFRE